MQQPCARCGATNQPGASTCIFCGSLLNSYTATQQVPPPGSYDPTQRVAAPGSYDATQRVPPPGMPSGSYQPPSAPYTTPYYPPVPPPLPPVSPVLPPYPAAPPVYFAAPAPPVVVLAPVPQKKKSYAWLFLAIGLPLLAVVGLVCAVVVYPLIIIANEPRTTYKPPPLYTASLTGDPGGWECQPNTQCQFAADGYHILAPDNHVYASELTSQFFSDAVIEVKGKIAKGNPEQAGLALIFRVVLEPEAYVFLAFGDGTYELVKWDDQGNPTKLIPITSSTAIHTGLNQINDLKVIADGSTLTLFANGKQLQQITDASYPDGTIALGAAATGTEAVFSQLIVTRPE
jgi:hypothetical protein